MTDIPPHFHKADRIEQKDLIPNGDYVTVVPDWPASEGTEVLYLNGSEFRIYRMLLGTWRQIGGAMWQLLISGTLGGAVPDLTLSFTPKSFLNVEIFLPTYSGSRVPALQFNSDTDANYGSNILTGTEQLNIATLADSLGYPYFASMTISNFEATEKTILGMFKYNNGAGSANQNNIFGSWANTSDQIDTIKLFDYNSGANLPIGTLMNVYGHD